MSVLHPLKGTTEPVRVLLLEDDPDDVVILQELLADSGVSFFIQHCDSLASAVQFLEGNDVNVVLADLTLPDSTGMETFRTLFHHPKRVPIIILSGLADETLALETVEEGAQDYLMKGHFDQGLLVRAMFYAITRAEAERALADERNLLRSVLDNLVDAVYVKDRAGKYLLGNAAHAKQLGLSSPSQAVGKLTTDLFPPDVAQKFRADDERVMVTGESIINRHEIVAEPGKTTRWLSTSKVPLRDGNGEVIGIVGIGRDITARKEAEEQLALYTRELQEKNAEMAGDLEMAREVQQAFLPQQFPSFPRSVPVEKSAIRFFSRYLPTTTLGGDFFYILPISDSKAGILICDVMGHGVRAALVTAIQRALVEELTDVAECPAEFLTQMNASLVSILRRTKSPMFASAFYVVVDAAARTLCYANAGHPKALHVKRSEECVTLLDGPGQRPGPALGVFEASKYIQAEASMKPRDLLMLFTDGLFEVENVRGEFFDHGLLVDSVREKLRKPVDQIFDESIEEVRQFSASKGFIDDVCLVGVELVTGMK